MTRRRRTGSTVATRGRARRPPAEIVAPAEAISSGVARSRSCPIAAALTARLSGSFATGEIVLGLAAGTFRRSPNPNARAVAANRRAPILAPSGANTELHDSAKARVSVPPHASSDALRSLTPDSVANVRIGYTVDGVAS